MADYDGRTALHLAVCGGNTAVVRFLVDKAKCNVNPLDRWNSTPLDDALVVVLISDFTKYTASYNTASGAR